MGEFSVIPLSEAKRSPMTSADYHRKWRAEGRCANCGCRPPKPNRVLCETCLAKGKRRTAEWNAARKAAGLCLHCDKPTTGTHVHCDEHRQYHNARLAAYKRNKRQALARIVL